MWFEILCELSLQLSHLRVFTVQLWFMATTLLHLAFSICFVVALPCVRCKCSATCVHAWWLRAFKKFLCVIHLSFRPFSGGARFLMQHVTNDRLWVELISLLATTRRSTDVGGRAIVLRKWQDKMNFSFGYAVAAATAVTYIATSCNANVKGFLRCVA